MITKRKKKKKKHADFIGKTVEWRVTTPFGPSGIRQGKVTGQVLMLRIQLADGIAIMMEAGHVTVINDPSGPGAGI